MTRIVNAILHAAAACKPVPLAYRGCIPYGKFRFEDNFYVGPAVDAAAPLMERAQGAFVWFTPEAVALLNPIRQNYPSHDNLPVLDYAVPLKGGDAYQTLVVSPFGQHQSPAERDAQTNYLLKTFAGSMDVEVKKQNTARFLRAASDALGTT